FRAIQKRGGISKIRTLGVSEQESIFTQITWEDYEYQLNIGQNDPIFSVTEDIKNVITGEHTWDGAGKHKGVEASKEETKNINHYKQLDPSDFNPYQPISLNETIISRYRAPEHFGRLYNYISTWQIISEGFLPPLFLQQHEHTDLNL